mmetsp:Transcript_29252/g.98594  ORF Transcript_29252/g.98594 Transcript_29252/m.98594 type:complete len:362 (-) Transcript_29252:197-1282(-)
MRSDASCTGSSSTYVHTRSAHAVRASAVVKASYTDAAPRSSSSSTAAPVAYKAVPRRRPTSRMRFWPLERVAVSSSSSKASRHANSWARPPPPSSAAAAQASVSTHVKATRRLAASTRGSMDLAATSAPSPAPTSWPSVSRASARSTRAETCAASSNATASTRCTSVWQCSTSAFRRASSTRPFEATLAEVRSAATAAVSFASSASSDHSESVLGTWPSMTAAKWPRSSSSSSSDAATCDAAARATSRTSAVSNPKASAAPRSAAAVAFVSSASRCFVSPETAASATARRSVAVVAFEARVRRQRSGLTSFARSTVDVAARARSWTTKSSAVESVSPSRAVISSALATPSRRSRARLWATL